MKTKYFKSGSYIEVGITTDRSGRTSITVSENPYVDNRQIIDIELPAKEGEFKDSFKPLIKVGKEIEMVRLGF
jgi:hypothetical protein